MCIRDRHDLGGITRDIYLYTLPQLNIAKLDVSTTFDASYRNAILKSEIEIANEEMCIRDRPVPLHKKS